MSKRYVKINENNLVILHPQQVDHANLLSDPDWIEVEEIDLAQVPEYDSYLNELCERKYVYNPETNRVTIEWEIAPKFKPQGIPQQMANSCPYCIVDYLEAPDKADNVVIQNLAKGPLKKADTI